MEILNALDLKQRYEIYISKERKVEHFLKIFLKLPLV